MAGIEHQVLERVRLVHKKMVYAHRLEIHRIVLAVVDAEFDVGKFRLQIHLTLDQSLFHGTGNGVSLLTQHFQVLLHAVQLILQDALLYLVRLGYHTELVVRKDDAVPVVVLDVMEDTLPFIGCKIVLARIKQFCVGICRSECLRNFLHVGFQGKNHRLVCQAQPLHLVSRHAHDERFSCSHLMVADAPSVEFEHPNGILLAVIQAFNTQSFQIKVGKCLMRAVILRSHKTVELVVIQFFQPLLEIVRLLGKPVGKSVSYLIYL